PSAASTIAATAGSASARVKASRIPARTSCRSAFTGGLLTRTIATFPSRRVCTNSATGRSFCREIGFKLGSLIPDHNLAVSFGGGKAAHPHAVDLPFRLNRNSFQRVPFARNSGVAVNRLLPTALVG